MTQLNPMIPVYIPRFNMEGYAFLVESFSQEHYLYFTVAMDNGEIWILDNREVRFCKNPSMERVKINKNLESELKHLWNKNNSL